MTRQQQKFYYGIFLPKILNLINNPELSKEELHILFKTLFKIKTTKQLVTKELYHEYIESIIDFCINRLNLPADEFNGINI